MEIKLDLMKPGEKPAPLQLNLKKEESFTALLAWEGKVDLDSHALVCKNMGNGGKISSLDDILSTYNFKRVVDGQEVGNFPRNPDGSFQIYGGALWHSKDVNNGDEDDIDEKMIVHPSRLLVPQGGALEIPVITMIHPQNSGTLFKHVQKAWLSVINSSNQEIAKITLSDQFGDFTGVQAGTFMIDGTGTHYVPVGVGFNCDFNEVLKNFC